MRHLHNLKLPKVSNLEMIRSVKITMSNDESYSLTVGDLASIQFIKDDNKILVRRGRIKDIVVVNSRELTTKIDNASRIILDCSEQFTVKIIEIKFSDIISIGDIDAEFEDYSDRITELESNNMHVCECGAKIPVREHGMRLKNNVTLIDNQQL